MRASRVLVLDKADAPKKQHSFAGTTVSNEEIIPFWSSKRAVSRLSQDTSHNFCLLTASVPVPGIPGHLKAAGDRAAPTAWEPFPWGQVGDWGSRVQRGLPPHHTAAAQKQRSLSELVAEPGGGAEQQPSYASATEGSHNARGGLRSGNLMKDSDHEDEKE